MNSSSSTPRTLQLQTSNDTDDQTSHCPDTRSPTATRELPQLVPLLFVIPILFYIFISYCRRERQRPLAMDPKSSDATTRDQRRKHYIDRMMQLKKFEPQRTQDENSDSIHAIRNTDSCHSVIYDTDEESQGDAMCTVCLSELEAGDSVSYSGNCIHEFHESCVRNWLLHHEECPCCRTNYLVSRPK